MYEIRTVIIAAVLLISAVILSISPAHAQDSIDVATRWKPPITRENGDTLAAEEIAAYKLYRKQGSALSVLATVTSGVSHNVIIPAGECFEMYVTAVDTSNLESKPSGTVTRCASNPDAPSEFQVTIP